MRKFIILAAVLGSFILSAAAQEPTTMWPYLFPEFRSGSVAIRDGGIKPYQVNIHLRHGALHYLDTEGLIREADLADVEGIEVDGEQYLAVDGKIMKVVTKSERGCVVAEILGNYDALNETGGAYGSSSSTSATRRLTSIDTDNQINQNHMLLMQSRSDGNMLGLVTTYYLVWPGASVKAVRSNVEKAIPEERSAEWKSWFKSHKIKWKQPESLIDLLDFFNP